MWAGGTPPHSRRSTRPAAGRRIAPDGRRSTRPASDRRIAPASKGTESKPVLSRRSTRPVAVRRIALVTGWTGSRPPPVRRWCLTSTEQGRRPAAGAQPAVGPEQGGQIHSRKTRPVQEKRRQGSNNTTEVEKASKQGNKKEEKIKLKIMHSCSYGDKKEKRKKKGRKRRLCSISGGQIGLAATRVAAVARPGPVNRI